MESFSGTERVWIVGAAGGGDGSSREGCASPTCQKSESAYKVRRGRSSIGTGGADVGGIQACSSFLMDLCWFAIRARRSFKEAS